MAKTLLTIAITSLLSISSVQAQEYLAHQDQSIDISLCTESLSLVRVEGAKIIRGDGVQGTVTTSDPAAIKETGNLLIAPITDKPFTYFVTDDMGRTWTLRVKPNKKMACESVLIKDVRNPYKVETSKDNPAMLKATSRDAMIKSLIQAMYKESTPKDMTVSRVDNQVPWWKESRFIQKSIYKANGAIGKSYVLTNITNQQMVMDEREFFIDDVIAVSVESLQLAPGESTRVFIVFDEAAR